MKKLAYIIFAALSLSACLIDKESIPIHRPGSGSETEDKRVVVTFNVTQPGQVNTPTRAAWSDSDIDNIDLLIFDESNKFLQRISADNITGSGGSNSFSVRIDASNKARTIHIVANGRDATTNADRINFSDISAAMLESQAIPGLVTNPMPVASEEAMTPLIMWGRVSIQYITSNTTINGVSLLRSQAVIQLGEGTANASNGLNNFTITSATLHSASARGRLTPANYMGGAALQILPNDVPSPRINYYTSNGYISTGATPLLYLYERINSTSDYVSLIIGGEWNGVAGYYKIFLKDNSGVPYHIIRNHRYIVTVVRASGTGYPTIAEAVQNESSNIEITITDARDELHFIHGDATMELGVSNNILQVISSGPNESTTIDIATVYATPDNSLSLSASSSATGLTNLVFSAPAADGTRKLRATVSSNVGSGAITIKYGKLSHTIDVIHISSVWTECSRNAVICPLFTSANKPWAATIDSGSENLFRVDDIFDTGTKYNGGTAEGHSYLDSYTTSANAWIYTHTKHTTIGIIDVHFMESGNFKKGKVMVVPARN